MKTTLTLAFLFLITSVNFLKAQDEIDTIAQKKFFGAWHMCQINNEVVKVDPLGGITIDAINLAPIHFYKFFSKSGEYTALAVSNTGPFINSSGTYDVFSDKYIENFSSSTNPNSTKSELPYKFYGDNHFIMIYTDPNGRMVYEVWKRVQQR